MSSSNARQADSTDRPPRAVDVFYSPVLLDQLRRHGHDSARVDIVWPPHGGWPDALSP